MYLHILMYTINILLPQLSRFLQGISSQAAAVVSQPSLQPFVSIPVEAQIAKSIPDTNLFPVQQANLLSAPDSSFQEHVRMFKEMISEKRMGSPMKDAQKKKTKRDKSPVHSSDSEFDEILGTYESRQKKDKSYQTFKKERRDRKGRTVAPSKGRQYADNRYKTREDEERRIRQEKSRQDRDSEERRKNRAKRKEEKERRRKQKEKEKKRQGKKSKKEKEEKEEKGEENDDLGELSSDDFELVADSEEEKNSQESEGEERAAGENSSNDNNKTENSEDKAETTLEEKNAIQLDGDVMKDVTESTALEISGEEKENEGKGFGFHIKSYEEILREKALRNMLERRQAMEKQNKEEKPPVSNKEVAKNAVSNTPKEKQLKAKENDENEIKEESPALKGKAVIPTSKTENDTKIDPSIDDDYDDDEDVGGTALRSQVVKVSAAKEADQAGSTTNAEDQKSSKTLKVVRRVAVKVKQNDAAPQTYPKQVKDRKSVEIYKPPPASTVVAVQSKPLSSDRNGAATIDETKDISRPKLQRLQTAREINQEKVAGKESNIEAASPGVKVKSFSEIMEEKRARRLKRFGEGSASGNSGLKRKLKAKHESLEKTKRRNSNEAAKTDVSKLASSKESTRTLKDSKERVSAEDVSKTDRTFDKSRTSFEAAEGPNAAKPKILKRSNSKTESKKKSGGEQLRKVDKKEAGLSLKSSRPLGNRKETTKSLKSPILKQQKVKREEENKNDDFDFDDLDAIDLDIGVEVEDLPELSSHEENIISSPKAGKEDESDNVVSQAMDDIREAVNVELKKKEDLLSDDELERELELDDLSSLASGEEIDDDDLMLELEEMINS
ncbi:DNA ligase 1-like isoform X1 [Rhopilema esculentum]|uniref:DNA ligase 1-like isoform X1 n=1 Tax=Rhopilema esculentum TaxID=499914 RepID=UPI0031D44F64